MFLHFFYIYYHFCWSKKGHWAFKQLFFQGHSKLLIFDNYIIKPRNFSESNCNLRGFICRWNELDIFKNKKVMAKLANPLSLHKRLFLRGLLHKPKMTCPIINFFVFNWIPKSFESLMVSKMEHLLTQKLSLQSSPDWSKFKITPIFWVIILDTELFTKMTFKTTF